jgi:hypothetical protein
MSLKEEKRKMANKVEIKGISKFEETITTFKREDDGTYTKVTKKVTRNRKDSSVKYHRKNNPVIEEGPYLLVAPGERFDDIMSFEGLNGETEVMHFRKIEAREE